ncbi:MULTISPECIES: fibronectin type III domain-containing protein [unclassified Nocardioides]|uniref:fibronectin type III domain-containing protein n=1 Tax=unclassified Nocardioides TaxID=2615069 RepID=UPI0009E80EDA|nr:MULTISPECIES: fibronectin type III domain-containing protein [unclassified Nocardioides]
MRLLARVLAAVLMATVLFHAGPVAAATKPSAPRAVKATPLNKAVKVTWAAPASTGGSRINAYAVQRRNTTTAPWVTVKYTGAAARAWTETGLVNGARFYYRVMARNGVGWGPTSPQVSAVPRTVPSSPRLLEADVHPGALGVYWSAPSSNGGASVDGYRVEWSTDGSTWTGATTSALPSQASPFLVPLNLGTRYWLQVRAHNAAGYGATTGAGPYRVYTTPGAVTGLAATVSSGQVQLTWTAPASNVALGVPAATAYLVEVSDDGGDTWATDSSTAQSPWVVDDLTNGIDYTFRVSALTGFTKLGPGLATEIAPGAPVGPPPSPRSLALNWDEVAGDHRLSWQPPVSDGGKPLTRYVAEYWNQATPPPYPTFTYSDPSQTSAIVGAFALDHQIRLRACNGPTDADCSPWTDPVGPITGPVTGLVATQSTAGATRTVVVDWDQPDNGLATSYDVLRKAADGDYASLATGVTDTQYADASTVAATDYTYKVVPHGGGTGAPRTTSITTGADQSLTLPTGPTALTEGGASATVAVSIGVVSTTDVVVTLASDSPAVAVESPVTIPAGSLSVDAEISAVQDANAVGEHVVLTATALGGLQTTTAVDVTDNDVPAIVVSSSDVAIPLGTTDTSVLVSLDRKPAGTVTVLATADPSPARASVPAEPLVFGPDDWNVPQALSITGTAKGGTSVTLSSAGLADRVVNISVTNAP